MARGNLIQGQGSGKVGDIVLMVRQGQQVSRVYTTSGARTGKEASEASRIQRVKFGSASNQWSLYRYVCSRMYRKGKSSKQSDYNYFVKRNAPLLPYLSKEENVAGVHVLQPGVFSEGTLGRIELVNYYNPLFSEGNYAFQAFDSGVNLPLIVNWASTLTQLKSALRAVYSSARKVTYLFSFATELSLEGGASTFVSQQVQHFPVIIDLYDEITQGENEQLINAYFASKISDVTLSSIVELQTGTIASGFIVLALIPGSEVELSSLGRLSVLIFATDDNASDCYTTILPEDGINPTAGAYSDWAAYRTTNALRLAADSYGYQSGVMRDDIASAGNEINIQVQAYAARLGQIDSKASAAFLKSVGSVEQATAKEVVKTAEKK